MNKTLFFTLLLCLSVSFSWGQWQYVTPVGSPNPQTESRICNFPSAQVGYVAGSQGSFSNSGLSKTMDGGNTWTALTFPDSNFTVNSMDFVTESLGYVAGRLEGGNYNPKLFKTEDGGQSWSDLSPDSINTSGGYEVVDFLDENNGYFGVEGSFFKTTDGGATWMESAQPGSYPMDIDFFDVNHGTIACWDGTFFYACLIYTTEDGGTTWRRDSIGTMAGWEEDIQRPTQDLAFLLARGNGWSSGPRLFKSTNSGQTWDTLLVPVLIDSSLSTTNLFFQDADTGYMTTSGRFILKTVDGGQNWFIEHTDTVPFQDFCMTNGAAYSVGQYGTCIKKDLATNRWESAPQPDLTFYPNPVQDELQIQLPEPAQNLTLWVQDPLGRTLTKVQLSHVEKLGLNTSHWPAGTYLVTVETPEWMVTRKVIRK